MYSATGFQLGQGQTSRETGSEGCLVSSGPARSPRPEQSFQDFAIPRLALLHHQGGTWVGQGCISNILTENQTKHTDRGQ